jgi:uncharacterized protein YabE (DUF348 family)/3D (Asp-Asp-Asp) domain-containing protein
VHDRQARPDQEDGGAVDPAALNDEVLLRVAEAPAEGAGREGQPAAMMRQSAHLQRAALQHQPFLYPPDTPVHSRRFHLALGVALVAAFVVALAVPIDSGSKGRGGPVLPVDAQSATGAVVPMAEIPFTVHGDGFPSRHTTFETTVGQALAAAGIDVKKSDLVSPAVETRLTPGMHVYITRSKMVRVILGGEQRLVYTRAGTVGALLTELGVQAQPGDRIFPGLSDAIRRGMSVSVVLFRDGVEVTDEPIAYETVYEEDPDMLQGEERLIQGGIDGYVRREFKITRLNDDEVSRELVSETVVAPTSEVIAFGTQEPATPAPAPVVRAPAGSFDGMQCVRSMNVYATWYSASSAGGEVTATGTGVYKGIVAVDPSVIPLGTRMWIPGYGYGLAADTGGAIKGNIIDLGYGAADVKDWIPRYLDICILG